MKLKFVINEGYDIATSRNIASLRKFSEEDLQDIKSLYEQCPKFLKLTKKQYQTYWDKINDKFFKFVEKITGHKWKYKDYECVISMVNKGSTNWGTSNVISVWWKDNPYVMRGVVAGELIISHYFEIIKKRYANENLTDVQIWALAEVAALHITTLEKELIKFWPWNSKLVGSHFHNSSYPQLNELRSNLKPIFLKRKNFDEYIKEGIKLVKKYSDTKLW